MMVWVSRLAWLITIDTESTRNGMSSLTIATTVWLLSKPSCAGSGLNTRIFAVPGLRSRTNSNMCRAMRAHSSAARPEMSSAGT